MTEAVAGGLENGDDYLGLRAQPGAYPGDDVALIIGPCEIEVVTD